MSIKQQNLVQPERGWRMVISDFFFVGCFFLFVCFFEESWKWHHLSFSFNLAQL